MAKHYDRTKPSLYYSLGHKIDNVFHTRLRLGLSSLNAHLFKINASHIDSPYCSCDEIPETVKHYFFFCPQYSLERKELESSLMNVIAGYGTLTVNEKLAVLLLGRNLNKTAGLAVAACVQKFIRNSKRFCN